MIKILAPYLLGGMLVSAGGAEIGFLAILYAMLRDWRFWFVGILALIVGVKIP